MAAVTNLTCFDDANVAQFAGLSDPGYVFAGYIDNYITWGWLVVNRPHNRLMSITLYGGIADVYDIEPGGGVVSQAPAHYYRWIANRAHMHTAKPVLYTMASTVQAVINEMSAAGISRDKYLIWSAHVGRGAHLCAPNVCGYPQADGTQWTWTALGRSLDQSILTPAFFNGGGDVSSTLYTEDSEMLVPSDLKSLPVALPVGSTWLTLFSNEAVNVTVKFAGEPVQLLALRGGEPMTLATSGKRGAHIARNGATDTEPFSVTYA